MRSQQQQTETEDYRVAVDEVPTTLMSLHPRPLSRPHTRTPGEGRPPDRAVKPLGVH